MTGLILRDVTDADLPVFFEQMKDPAACHMAAFTTKDPSDFEAFMRFWRRIRADDSVITRTIEWNDAVPGHLVSYVGAGRRQVCYWLGRAYWDRGIATAALRGFLKIVTDRPLYARAARDNAASIRVLEKCGFAATGSERGFANSRGEEIDEVSFLLA